MDRDTKLKQNQALLSKVNNNQVNDSNSKLDQRQQEVSFQSVKSSRLSVAQQQQRLQQQMHLRQLQQSTQNSQNELEKPESYSNLYLLIDDLVKTLQTNQLIKNEIWSEIDLISLQLSKNYNPKVKSEANDKDESIDQANFKYSDQISHIDWSSSSCANLPIEALFKTSLLENMKHRIANTRPSPSPPSSKQSKSDSLTFKEQKISKLKQENKNLMVLLKERQTYNSELLDTIDVYESQLIEILELLSANYVSLNTKQLNDQTKYAERFNEMKKQMHLKFMQLVEIDEKSKQVYELLQPLVKQLNNGDSSFTEQEVLARSIQPQKL
ncbi:hypothetical protein CANARDRAFT_29627 [[Candida] arabinofermentans NRRL YB-2248]|uniref:Uncharacterized protein n=1 Tax=[Candida] arabinofermentans NRRL YB-2248 TaxID=983967 RepID=A0A1E4SWM4_9ASCO|nr:hypothetical protein CANARDRAFT_29627 [[Candida] arabinofermentans NRRL YB-2248]